MVGNEKRASISSVNFQVGTILEPYVFPGSPRKIPHPTRLSPHTAPSPVIFCSRIKNLYQSIRSRAHDILSFPIGTRKEILDAQFQLPSFPPIVSVSLLLTSTSDSLSLLAHYFSKPYLQMSP